MDFPCCHLEVSLALVNIPLHNLQVFALQLQYKHTLYCMFVYVQANRDRLSSLSTCLIYVLLRNSVCVALVWNSKPD